MSNQNRITVPEKLQRKIRSFVRREGRLTKGQQRALTELFPRYGIPEQDLALDMTEVFGRSAPVTVEIGFGNGETLTSMAAASPQTNFLGIEVHRPGVGNLLLQLEKLQLQNVRVICADAVDVLTRRMADNSLDAVHIFFPDPWHKKRHHKRRLVQVSFVQLLKKKLRPGGLLHLATDWEHYARHMLDVMQQVSGFINLAGAGQFSERPASRPLTKFEQRGQRLGHDVWDLLFEKQSEEDQIDG